MFTLKQLVVLALAGTTFALPLAHRGDDAPEFHAGRLETSQWFSTKSGYPSGFTGGKGDSDKDDTTTVVVVTDGSDTTPTTTGSSGSNSNSSPSSTPSTTTPTTGSQDGYMAVVSKWRAAGGYSALTKSAKLEANAYKTANDGNGKMVHQLNPGTMGQVLAPGKASDFEKVYVGGWLCEMSNLPGLNGICKTMTAGWDHSNGETGHAEILTSKSYSQIGCALADGIWACDLA